MDSELGLGLDFGADRGRAAGAGRVSTPELEAEAAHLLKDLDAAQRLAVTSLAAPLCIRAGPGSGKTRVLTRRIAYRIAIGTCDARSTVAVTFTQRAAAELRHRLQALGVGDRVVVGTFHGLASRQLRRHAADDGRKPPDILADPSRVLANLLRPDEPVRVVQAELDWCAARGIAAVEYLEAAVEAGRRTPLRPQRLVEIMHAYAHAKRRRGQVDFGDLLRGAAERLERDPTTAEAWRWRHRHFFVDELQDLSPAQFRLLRAWLGEGSDLCAVGDTDQAIFGWGGADRRMLADFAKTFAGGSVIDLTRNYRCDPRVASLAAAIKNNPVTEPGDEKARAAQAGTGRTRAAGTGATKAGAGTAAAPAGGGNLESRSGAGSVVVRYCDAAAEAAGVAMAVRRGRGPGEPWAAQAVLVRTRRQVGEMVDALAAVGVPAEVADPDREEGAADANAAGGRDAAAARAGGRDDAAARAGGTGAGGDAVCVSTMHAAKGLEWPVVHVAGLEEGLVPLGTARDPEAVEEERRLLYVAVTRARRRVHLSWAAERALPAQPRKRRPCRWLEHLGELAERDGGSGASDARPNARPAGQPLPDLAPPAEGLEAALIRWRAQKAREARVAPAAVLTDHDLAALTKARPASLADLEQVTGLGPSRLRRIGSQLLSLVAEHPPAPAPARPRLRLIDKSTSPAPAAPPDAGETDPDS